VAASWLITANGIENAVKTKCADSKSHEKALCDIKRT